MRERDALVVAPQEAEEVLREIVLVELRERSHDPEIERDVAALRRDEDVPGMHVGVEEAVAEHLHEKNLDAGARELLDVDALLAQRRHLVDGRAVHALHDHHFFGAEVPVDLGDEQQRRAFEIAPELARVRRFAQEIELVLEVFLELAHDGVRLATACLRPSGARRTTPPRAAAPHRCR